MEVVPVCAYNCNVMEKVASEMDTGLCDSELRLLLGDLAPSS